MCQFCSLLTLDPMDIVKEVSEAQLSVEKHDNNVLFAMRESLALGEEEAEATPNNSSSKLVNIPGVFSEREMRSIAARMWKVREHWTHELELMPFFTFGRSTHHDGSARDATSAVARNNIAVEDQFGFVHQRVLQVREIMHAY
jgi:hypothetical protein